MYQYQAKMKRYISSNTYYINGVITISIIGQTYSTGSISYCTVNGGGRNYFNIGGNSSVFFGYRLDGNLENQSYQNMISYFFWNLTEEKKEKWSSKIPNSNSGIFRIGLYSTLGSSTQDSLKIWTLQ